MLTPLRIQNRFTFAKSVTVFSRNDDDLYAVLTSNVHREWAWAVCGTHESGNPRYIPRRVVWPFPFPVFVSTPGLGRTVQALHSHRRDLMLKEGIGLSDVYGRMNDRDRRDPDMNLLRELHAELDAIVCDVYGWAVGNLDHGFHPMSDGVRFTMSPDRVAEILDRLVAMNHQRHHRELDQSGHDGQGARRKRLTRKGKREASTSDLLEKA
jgi:hypothetical protein